MSPLSISITAAAGSETVKQSLQIAVAAAPAVTDPFQFVGGNLVHGYFDPVRQLLFAANADLNEVDVFSGNDFSLLSRVPAPQPWGIDQMADGRTLVIGTQSQQILTMDEDTLTVTTHPFAATGNFFFSLYFPNVVAMANGKVLMIGLEQGIDSNSIFDGGQTLYEWDSTSNSFSQLEPPASSLGWETDQLARSADHKWAIFSADKFYLYSSDTETLATAALSTVNPPDNQFGVRGYAINSDGSEIAVISAAQATFLDRNLAVLGTVPIPSAYQQARGDVRFSADDQHLYLQYGLTFAIEEVDARTMAAVGYFPWDVNPDSGGNLARVLALDGQGRGYVGADGGLRVVNLALPPLPNPSSGGGFPQLNCPAFTATLPVGSSLQQASFGNLAGTAVYVGGQPVSAGNNTITIPASDRIGAADETCVDSAGHSAVEVAAVSYGVEPLALNANWLPPFGNPSAVLTGFGFFDSSMLGLATQPPLNGSISLGGQAGLDPVVLGGFWYGTTEEGIGFRVPNGQPGSSVALNFTGPEGTAVLASAAMYYSTPKIIPATGLLQLLYDPHRNLIYALKLNEIDVFDPATLSWQSPLSFPAPLSGTTAAMALSPDGGKLVVENVTGFTSSQFVVVDPNRHASPITVPGPGTHLSGSLAVSADNIAVLAGFPIVALDLSSLTFATIPSKFGGPDGVAASADGTAIYGAQFGSSGGGVFAIDPKTDTVLMEQFGDQFWFDLAVSPDGHKFAAIDFDPTATGTGIGFFDAGLRIVNDNVYPDFSSPGTSGMGGAIYSPAGKVLVVPLQDGLEFWDADKGTLEARLLAPEPLMPSANAVKTSLAMDPTGSTVYALSSSGVTVIPLPEKLDQMSPQIWPERYAAVRHRH